MKKFAFLFALCSLMFIACEPEKTPIEVPAIEVESVVVTPATYELSVNEEATLGVEILPQTQNIPSSGYLLTRALLP